MRRRWRVVAGPLPKVTAWSPTFRWRASSRARDAVTGARLTFVNYSYTNILVAVRRPMHWGSARVDTACQAFGRGRFRCRIGGIDGRMWRQQWRQYERHKRHECYGHQSDVDEWHAE